MNAADELKSHFEVLTKIESFEKQVEFNRFLLILGFGGFISIIAGWMEYIALRFFGTSLTFFQYLNSPPTSIQPMDEPILFISTWLIVLMLIGIVIFFSVGTSGFISWNKTYRIIGLVAVILYLSVNIIILLIGPDFIPYSPMLWGIAICIGFIFSAFILREKEQANEVFRLLLFIGFLALVLGTFSTVININEAGQLVFLQSFGITLILTSASVYIIKGNTALKVSQFEQSLEE